MVKVLEEDLPVGELIPNGYRNARSMNRLKYEGDSTSLWSSTSPLVSIAKTGSLGN